MLIRPFALIVLFSVAPYHASESAAQRRLTFPTSLTVPSETGSFATLVGRDHRVRIAVEADERLWRKRNAFKLGLAIGAAAGLGIAIHRGWQTDFKCPAEWMFPCELEYPVLTVYGAAAGGFFGSIFSLPGPTSVASPTPVAGGAAGGD